MTELYRYTGSAEDPIDETVWVLADVTTPDGVALFTQLEGSGVAEGAPWELYTGDTIPSEPTTEAPTPVVEPPAPSIELTAAQQKKAAAAQAKAEKQAAAAQAKADLATAKQAEADAEKAAAEADAAASSDDPNVGVFVGYDATCHGTEQGMYAVDPDTGMTTGPFIPEG